MHVCNEGQADGLYQTRLLHLPFEAVVSNIDYMTKPRPDRATSTKIIALVLLSVAHR